MIDTSIQLNNHNSYHATELFWADPFSVQTMSHITASFALYSDVVQAAANRIKIRFYTASGATVSETSHAFAVNTIWERVSVTVPVPATAEKAQICFLAGSYWWAESKVEEGQTATPYAINAAGQLTWISPNGVYTGTVTAQQVIVSPLSGSTEKDLESRLVTINSNAINLKATTDNNVSRLTTIEAGQITLRSDVDGALPKITKLTAGGVYTGEVVASQMKTGILKSLNNYSSISLDNGTFSFGNGALTWNGASLVGKGSFESTGDTQAAKMDGGSFRLMNNGVDLGYFSVQAGDVTGPWITAAAGARTINIGKLVGSTLHTAYEIIYPNASSFDATHNFYGAINVYALNTWAVRDQRGKDRLRLYEDGGMYLMNHLGAIKLWSDSSSTFIQHAASKGALGVDSTGPFYITNAGTKKYLT